MCHFPPLLQREKRRKSGDTFALFYEKSPAFLLASGCLSDHRSCASRRLNVFNTARLGPATIKPYVARAAGFERPILHGMANMGVAAHAVLRALLDYDATRLATKRVRLTAPELPGDTLRTD